MSFPVPSDISQNNAKILKKQRQEIQQRHEEEQQLLEQLEEVAKSHQAECVAQKAKREAKEKAQEEAERQRVAEEEKRKKRTMEYLQWFQNKILEEEAALLEEAEGSQVVGSKCKEVTAGDEERQRPSKKTRKKYYRDATVKMGGTNLCERCVSTGQDCLVHSSRWVFFILIIIIILIIFFFIAAPLPVLGTSHSSSGVYPTPILTSQP